MTESWVGFSRRLQIPRSVPQLTPTIKVQPGLEFVWNPAFDPDDHQAVVFRFQPNIAR